MSRSDEIRDMINNILINVRKRAESSENAEKNYEDEPIVKRASDLFETPETKPEREVPEKIRELRRIETAFENRLLTDTALFCKEARFMADYEDAFSFDGTFFCYYPTYRQMSDDELRGYFSMRSKIRRGILPDDPPLSFLFVYIYEQINLIGAESPEAAFENLKKIYEKYGEKERKLNSYLSVWLSDFVLYYDLDGKLIENLPVMRRRRLLGALLAYGNKSDEEIRDALFEWSDYRPQRSAFFKQYPSDFARAAVKLYKKMCAHAKKSCKTSYFARCFAEPYTSAYAVFTAALFGGAKHADFDRDFDELTHFSCRNGHFARTGYPDALQKSAELGDALRALDAVYREKTGFPAPLKDVPSTKTLKKMIDESISEVEAEKAEEKRKKIEIDLSSLKTIRADADLTMGMLLTEEETASEMPAETDAPAAVIVSTSADNFLPQETIFEAAAPPEASSPLSVLTAAERDFLREIAAGGTGGTAAKGAGKMPSVLADGVNDKLYDLFADTVIECKDNGFAVVPDYLEELKGILRI